MLTQKDINELKEIFPTKEDLESKTRLLPTRDEFFGQMDEVMHELKAVRESQEAHAADHVRINDDINQIKRHVGSIPII